MSCPLNFERSISVNDLDSLKVREIIQEDIVSPEDETKHCHLKCTAEYTFVLQSFKELSLDFKKFLYSYLLDFGIYRELEEDKKLNWCPSLFSMVPVLTLADGNCLMHAASIGMWAVNDRYHTLRKMVYNALLEDIQGIFHRRWQREHQLTNLSPHGCKMTEEQWVQEWQIVLQLVSQEERPFGQSGMKYDSLEEIHVFVLANVLRRTIIVISSDTFRGNYDDSLSPIHFSGIYLPLNWDPVYCVKTPLVIGYSHGHFTSIVSFEDGVFDQGEAMDGVHEMPSKIHGIPLQKHDGTPLPVHFLFESEECLTEGLLRQYLDCKKLTHKVPEDGSLSVILVAKLLFVPPPGPVKKLVDGFFSRARETYQYMVQTKSGESAGASRSLAQQPCKTEGCEFFGTSETLFMCSKCLEQYLRSEGNHKVAPLAYNEEFPGIGAAFRDEYAHGKHIGAGTSGKRAFSLESPQLTAQKQREIMQQTQQQEQQEQREIERFQQLQLQQRENDHLKQQQERQQETKMLEPQQQRQEGKRLQQQNIDLLQQQQQQEAPQEPSKCITNGCKYKANKESGNLCSRCHESEVMAERQTASIVSMNIPAKPCANSVNGCQFHGIQEQDGFCSWCYRKFCLKMESNVIQRSEETASSSSSAVVFSPSAENICQTLECPNTGCPELYNICVQCYSMCIKNFIASHER